MRVGRISFDGRPRPPTNACDHIKLQTFFERDRFGVMLRGFAGSAVIFGSAYC